MQVHSYFELATTLIGWHVANGIAQMMAASGLVLLPLAVLLWRNWSEPIRSQSSRDAAVVSLRRMEHDALLYLVIIVLAFLPAVPVSRADVQFSEPYADSALSAQEPLAPYADAPRAIGVIRVPLLWWLVYQVASMFTNQVVALIDTLTDPAVLRASLLRIAELSFSDASLIAELRQFREDCYEPSLAKYQAARNPPRAHGVFEAVDWLGSHLFIQTEGYYRMCSDVQRCGTGHGAASPVPGWPPGRAADPGSAQPRCDSWWDEPGIGLRARLMADVYRQAPWFQDRFWQISAALSDPSPVYKRQIEDRVLRRMLNEVPQVMAAKADRGVAAPFMSLEWLNFDGLQQLIGTLGALTFSALMHIVMELVVVGLPMLQALLLMVLYAALPLMVPFAVLQPGMIVRAVLILFALRFLSALWALAEFLDEKLLQTMYPDASVFEFGGSGTVSDVVLGLITLLAYLALPIAWFMLVGALGSRAALALGGTVSQWSARLEGAAGSATRHVQNALGRRRH